MHFCNPDILLTRHNTTLFTLFYMTFSFFIVVFESWILFSHCFYVTKKYKTANSKHIDSSVRQRLNAWNEPTTLFERSLLPHDLFELFSTNTEMERICVESTNYARLKDNHMFTMTVEKLKTILTILLVSGYAGLPRQEMYR